MRHLGFSVVAAIRAVHGVSVQQLKERLDDRMASMEEVSAGAFTACYVRPHAAQQAVLFLFLVIVVHREHSSNHVPTLLSIESKAPPFLGYLARVRWHLSLYMPIT